MIYFVYDARLDPGLMEAVAPSAVFLRIAHLPETRLTFPIRRDDLGGAIPSLLAEPGNTVWGALFELEPEAAKAYDAEEADEGRVPTEQFRAVDREGTAYPVITHVAVDPEDTDHRPSVRYMEHVVAGSRHWGLPTGWVAGLEEYLDDLFL